MRSISKSFGSPIPLRYVMTTEKKKPALRVLPKKTYWHLYSLQNMECDKLAKTINKVLRKEYVLIK